MLDSLHYEDFVPHVSSSFRLVLANGTTHQLALIAVKDLSTVPSHEQFSLHFHAPLMIEAAQGTYHLEHEVLGTGDIFLVPVARQAEGYTFEAIFNRPRATESPRV